VGQLCESWFKNSSGATFGMAPRLEGPKVQYDVLGHRFLDLDAGYPRLESFCKGSI
jgi:hypothetical protein